MAWTEQCKIAFKCSADAKYWKAGNKGISKILRELSEESGIPFKTLERWYYEKDPREDPLNNEGNQKLIQNQEVDEKNVIERPICSRCQKYPVALSGENKKPYGPTSKYFGLCGSCRKLLMQINKNNAMARCPHCKKSFKLTKDLMEINKNVRH